MLSGLSFPVNLDRGRNKERLEASLAGLLELQFLRQRQEFLVKGALQIAGCRRDQDPFAFNWDLNGGDTFFPGAGFREAEGSSLRRHLNGLRRQEAAAHNPLQQLERQVSELHLDAAQPVTAEPEIDSRPSSAEPLQAEQEESLSYTDSDYVSSVPRSFSATHTESLEALADARSKYQSELLSREGLPHFPYPSPLHAMAKQSPLLCQALRAGSEDQPFSPNSFLGSYKLEGDGDMFFGSPGEFPHGLESVQSKKLENYITGLVHKRVYPVRSSKPRTSLTADPMKGLMRQNSLCQRVADQTSPQNPSCEQLYPPAERGNISNSHSFDGCLPVSKYRPQWISGGEQIPVKKSIAGCQTAESFAIAAAAAAQKAKGPEESQHSHSLRRQIRLMTNTPPMRPTSLEYHELNYHPALRGSPQEAYYQNVYELEDRPQAFACRPDSIEVHEQCLGSEARGKRSPLPGSEDGAYQMVNAQYIPAKQPHKGHVGGQGGRAKAAMLNKCRSADMSPEVGGAPPPPLPLLQGPREKGKAPGGKKCRFSEEAEGAKRGGHRPSPRGKKTCRSNSENSLLHRQASASSSSAAPAPAGVKYNTVERDEGRTARPRRHPGSGGGGHRRWRSTAEICQDEGVPGATATTSDPYPPGEGPRRPRRYLKAPGAQAQAGSDSEYRGRDAVAAAPGTEEAYAGHCFGDSESSLSEVESPGFSTCSSETDEEGGGLVWPQQVAPQAAGRSAAQPKVFVKIKASHALKKKILRFRTGSLKVMTTV